MYAEDQRAIIVKQKLTKIFESGEVFLRGDFQIKVMLSSDILGSETYSYIVSIETPVQSELSGDEMVAKFDAILI